MKIRLSDNTSIPVMGVGTWTLKGEVAVESVRTALEMGFRLVDTAQWYENEAEVGKGIALSGVPREEIFLTTKVIPSMMRNSAEEIRRSIEVSLEKLGTGYIDMVLIHWPVMDHLEKTWKVLEEFVAAGKIRSLGVSNFNPHHLEDLFRYTKVRPVLNQIEIHPYLVQEDLVAYSRSAGMQVQAWGTFGQGNMDITGDPLLQELAASYGKTASQIVLRWCVQRGLVVIPRARIHHLQENLDVMGFELSDEDMARISALDRNLRSSEDNDPETFTY